MLRDDRLVRCVLYPRGIEDGVLSIEALLNLTKEDDDLGIYGMSVAPSCRFNSVEDVHAYGLRVAVSANTAIAARKGVALEDHELCHYLGYYEFPYATTLDIDRPLHTFGVVWKPEDNLNEHCDFFVRWNGRVSTRRERKRERLEAMTQVPHSLIGPTRYMRPADDPVAEQLNTVVLPELPEGVVQQA